MKTRNILLIAVAAVCTLASCSKLLDIPQKGVLNFETYYQTDEEIQAAAIPMYSTLKGNAYYFKLAKEMFTDDVYCGGSARNDNIDLEKMNEYTFDAEESYIQGMFEALYSIIYRANVILGHVDEGYSDLAKQIRAEAKVFRAYSYFELITMWGNPPVVDHELAPSEYNVPNGSTEELWALVETDLTEAIASGKLAQKSSLNDRECWKVTQQFAQALLGKAYLWMATALNDNSYYAKSAAQFDAVVSSGKYDLYNGEYSQLRRDKHNCEIIFSSNTIHDDNNVWNNMSMFDLMVGWRSDRMYYGTCPLATYSWGFRIPRKGLYEAFVADEGEDGYRLNETLKTYAQIQELWGAGENAGDSMICDGYFFFKQQAYQDDVEPGSMGFANVCDLIWMRYAEVLLCGAEAHFKAGNNSKDKAQEYVDKIRARAGLASVPVTMDVIKTEKRLELCAEGTRFQDLLRWGEAYEAMKDNGSTYPVMTSNGEVTYQSCGNSSYGFKQGKNERLPYPATEIRLNNAIEQNPGWE